MVGPVYLTESGKAALEAELHDLIHSQRPAVIARIKAAKELGDLRENADYEIARNEQSFIEGKVLEIEEKLRNAEIIDENASTDEVALGLRKGPLEVQPIPQNLVREWTVEADFIQAVRNPAAPRPKPDFTEGTLYMRVVDAVNRSLATQTTESCI
jgi:hypothetical protein